MSPPVVYAIQYLALEVSQASPSTNNKLCDLKNVILVCNYELLSHSIAQHAPIHSALLKSGIRIVVCIEVKSSAYIGPLNFKKIGAEMYLPFELSKIFKNIQNS